MAVGMKKGQVGIPVVAPVSMPVTSARGSIDALLEAEDVALELLPGQCLPVFSMRWLLSARRICHKT
jgi:hypothetical protein